MEGHILALAQTGSFPDGRARTDGGKGLICRAGRGTCARTGPGNFPDPRATYAILALGSTEDRDARREPFPKHHATGRRWSSLAGLWYAAWDAVPCVARPWLSARPPPAPTET